MPDLRDDIFRGVAQRRVTAEIVAAEPGIVAETRMAAEAAQELGLNLDSILEAGDAVTPGRVIARFSGSPKQIALAEDRLIGLMSKASGIATAARRFVEKAGSRPRIVSGAWKKMPLCQKESIRRAVAVGGADGRISDRPFLYLDKNYVRMLGGLAACLEAVSGFKDRLRVVQIKGEYGDLVDEACLAARNGAGIVFIDTGRRDDLARVGDGLRRAGLRCRAEIAFGGGVRLEDVEALKALDVDVLDVGRGIVDAPLLDMRLEVVKHG